jgi:DNA-binding beta-propeller fold protein YncE
VLQFSPAGVLLQAWGGPGQGYEWPQSNHGIFVDHQGNVWIGGNGAGDSHLLKFTRNGKFIAQYGKAGVHRGPTNAEGLSTYAGDSNDRQNFGRVAKIFVDPRDNEAYIADGYLNKRVAVLDATSGMMKRYWGAYGNKPDDTNLGPYNPDAPPAQQFRNPVHCADLSNDNLVYVCDRANNRIQVFQKDGKFVKEGFIARRSLGEGSVWDVAFSRDPQQTYIFLADGRNHKVRILRRDTLEELTAFGDGGRQPGLFYGVHSIAVDSKGNLYTTETYEGKRVQKFIYRGIGNVPRVQGVLWPRT